MKTLLNPDGRIAREGVPDDAVVAEGWTLVDPGSVPEGTPRMVITPKRLRKMTPLEFLGRFNLSELAALKTAERNDAALAVIMLKTAAAQEIDLDYPETQQAKAFLVDSGYLTTERAEEIFS
jgi:hypothetical protein